VVVVGALLNCVFCCTYAACVREPPVGVVLNYCVENGIWLYCKSVINLVVNFRFSEDVEFLYGVHHLAFYGDV
jgi:hypothetical protein